MNFSDFDKLADEIRSCQATLVAVSKTRPASELMPFIQHGQLDFGENYVQELIEKHEAVKQQVNWHFIGHLQRNKVKQIVPFVYLIQGVDSLKLLTEIGAQSVKCEKTTPVLLQVHIADEETKFGVSPDEISSWVDTFGAQPIPGVEIRGLMGMATLTGNEQQITAEFKGLRKLFDAVKNSVKGKQGFDFNILSMGMTSDYRIALAEGSTMVRIGSAIFGSRG
ncbi:MAG TPA: YggS family pyridoxal phosphate-dependent enzyme [Bacteroidia bacterium]|nr:YggS family pyridoxal phosphate-dependent enzyme [Bacteroidia bacterium]